VVRVRVRVKSFDAKQIQARLGRVRVGMPVQGDC
jgi:hypothetical protein